MLPCIGVLVNILIMLGFFYPLKRYIWTKKYSLEFLIITWMYIPILNLLKIENFKVTYVSFWLLLGYVYYATIIYFYVDLGLSKIPIKIGKSIRMPLEVRLFTRMPLEVPNLPNYPYVQKIILYNVIITQIYKPYLPKIEEMDPN